MTGIVLFMSYHVDSRYISLYTWSAIIQVYHYCTTWTHLPFVWGCNWLWHKFNPFEQKSMLVHIFNKFDNICQLVDCLFLAHSTVDIYYPLYINVIFTFSLINLKILLLYTHLALSYYIYIYIYIYIEETFVADNGLQKWRFPIFWYTFTQSHQFWLDV